MYIVIVFVTLSIMLSRIHFVYNFDWKMLVAVLIVLFLLYSVFTWKHPLVITLDGST